MAKSIIRNLDFFSADFSAYLENMCTVTTQGCVEYLEIVLRNLENHM